MDLESIPDKKIYISRKHIPDRTYGSIKRLPFSDDNRLYDDDILEEYLRSKGFEIVIPENLANFEEQINLFSKAKIIVSLTSSGITNCFFMRPGSKLLEIMSPITSSDFNPDENGECTGMQSLHHIYVGLAFLKSHTYIGIPNWTRHSQDIINYIEERDFLKRLLDE